MDYIKIEGYKSIHSETIPLAPINILIGANGSGKSNFISFFDFLNRLYNRKLNDYIALSGGDNKILHKGKKHTKKIFFEIKFQDFLFGYAVTLTSGTDGFIVTNERLIYQDRSTDISKSSKEAQIKKTDHPQAEYIIKNLNSFRKYHFHDTSKHSSFTNLSHIENDIHFLYSDGSNLAAFLFNIQQTNKIVYNRILKTVQSIAPYFSDFYYNPYQEQQIRLQWTDRYSDVIFGASDLSDGTLRFIALTVLFMQPKLPSIIVIDEPELGLHPKAIAKFAGMVKSASSKGSQIIIATQSTDFLSHFSPEDIITIDQINGESKFKRLNSDDLQQWLEDYTIDDLWKRNIITTGQPNF